MLIELFVDIDAPLRRVWREIADVERHIEWMEDAAAIRITSSTVAGVGMAFDCDTVVGPFRMTDHMVVSHWDEGRSFSLHHKGLVSGRGTFALTAIDESTTRFTWTEHLRIPWFMGGPIGAVVARFMLTRLWREDLRSLKARCEDEPGLNPLAYFEAEHASIKSKKRARMWRVCVDGIGDYAKGQSAYSARVAAMKRHQA